LAAAPHWCGGYLVADFQASYLAPDLDNLAREFMAQDSARLHAKHRIMGHVQIAPADAAATDLNDHLVGSRFGHSHVLYPQGLIQSLKNGRLHSISYFNTLRIPAAIRASSGIT
jgi:hypothetical protein